MDTEVGGALQWSYQTKTNTKDIEDQKKEIMWAVGTIGLRRERRSSVFFCRICFCRLFFLRELLPAAVYMWQREHVLAVLNEALIYVLRKPLGEGRGQL